jgi:hypothetical protein
VCGAIRRSHQLKKRVRPAPGIGNPEAETGQLVVCSLDTSPLMGVGNCKIVWTPMTNSLPKMTTPNPNNNETLRLRAQALLLNG